MDEYQLGTVRLSEEIDARRGTQQTSQYNLPRLELICTDLNSLTV